MKIKNLLMTIATAAAPLMVAAPAFAYESHRTQATSHRTQAQIEIETAKIEREFKQRRDAYLAAMRAQIQEDRRRLDNTQQRDLAFAQREREAERHYAQEEALKQARIAALTTPRYEVAPSRWNEDRQWERRDDQRVRYDLRRDDRDPPRDLIRELHTRGEYRTPDPRFQLRVRF